MPGSRRNLVPDEPLSALISGNLPSSARDQMLAPPEANFKDASGSGH